MKPKTMITNQTATTKNPKMNKFWNFLDNGDTAELQLFGTIQSEEDWWSDDCVTYRDFINELNALGNKKTINVIIQSGGGDVFAANAIYNALVMNNAKINGKVIGICASAATIILMACDSRSIAKNAILMVHNPSATLRGSYQAEELIKLAEVTEQVKKSIVTAYMEKLDKTEDEINQLMDIESWYVGQEAVDAGFCDSVIDVGFNNSILNHNFNNNFIVNDVAYSFKNYIEKFVPDNILKKVQNLSDRPKKETRAFFDTPKQTQEGNVNMDEDKTMPIISNISELKAAYPELCAQIANDAVLEERKRLKAIDEIANGIPEDVLIKARYDEPISAAELALAQMKANNVAGKQFLNDMVQDMQNSGAVAVGTEPNTGYDPESQKNIENAQNLAGFAAALKKDKRRGVM